MFHDNFNPADSAVDNKKMRSYVNAVIKLCYFGYKDCCYRF